MTTNNPKTLGQIALDAAVKSVGNVDSACYDATVSLSLVLASKQFERMEQGESMDSESSIAANKGVWRAFLKEFAYKANPVWRDTQHLAERFRTMKPDARRKAAAEYIDKKDKGSRLIDGLARIRTQTFRLMEDVCTNHMDALRNIRALKEAGTDAQGQIAAFGEFVAANYGATYAELESALAPTPKKRNEKSPVDALFEKAEQLPLTDLQALAARIQALYSKRAADEADVSATFGGTETETKAEERAAA